MIHLSIRQRGVTQWSIRKSFECSILRMIVDEDPALARRKTSEIVRRMEHSSSSKGRHHLSELIFAQHAKTN
jgi:hypothetical protein